MSTVENLPARIHEANVAVHRSEAKYYRLIHPEVYRKQEQKRIYSTLRIVDQLISDNKKKALDFGAGTGNLTGKLLGMGYHVTAVDISPEMCEILKKQYQNYLEAKNLIVINSQIENLSFDEDEFDLITCYSVLHHLPDYLGALQRLTIFLKKGGAIYIDHEDSPYYWTDESSNSANFLKHTYYHSAPFLNSLYFQMIGAKIPTLDYTLSDYWHKKEHHLDHEKIKRVFEKMNFDYLKRVDYHLNGTWVFNPIFYLYKHACKPETSYWIARK